MIGIEELGLGQPLRDGLEALGYEELRPAQRQVVSALLGGGDVVVESIMGGARATAYALSMLERADPADDLPGALVLLPTREQALEVAAIIAKLGRARSISVVPLFGGQPIERQARALRRGAQVVVATPGRLLDHLRRRSVNLNSVKLVIMDDADDLLAMGLLEEIEQVLEELPHERQMAVFASSGGDQLSELTDAYLRDPTRIEPLVGEEVEVAAEQRYFEVPSRRRLEALVRLMDVKQPELALVFCAERRSVDQVAEELEARGQRAEGLHGGLDDSEREGVLKALRTGKLDVLALTDSAGRELDLDNVTHVVGFDLPADCEQYLERAGHVGRGGRGGQVLSLAAPSEVRQLRAIERLTGSRIERGDLTTVSEMEDREREHIAERVLATLREGRWGQYRELVAELAEEHEPCDIAAAALAVAAAGGIRRVPEAGRQQGFQPQRQGGGQPRPPQQEQQRGAGQPQGQRQRGGGRPWFADRPRQGGGPPPGAGGPRSGRGGRRRGPTLGPPSPPEF